MEIWIISKIHSQDYVGLDDKWKMQILKLVREYASTQTWSTEQFC